MALAFRNSCGLPLHEGCKWMRMTAPRAYTLAWQNLIQIVLYNGLCLHGRGGFSLCLIMLMSGMYSLQ